MSDNFKNILTSRRRPAIGLRIAPLIDMIFLLLIFFLVTAKWSPQEDFLPLQLPAANAGTSQTPLKAEPLVFQITRTQAGCRVQIGSLRGAEISSASGEQGLASLMEQTKLCLSEQNRYAADPVQIICDSKVKWEYIAQIYNCFYGMGITDITFQMSEPENDISK